MKRSILLGILTVGLTFGTITAGTLTVHSADQTAKTDEMKQKEAMDAKSQEGQPRNYAEETKKHNDELAKAEQEKAAKAAEAAKASKETKANTHAKNKPAADKSKPDPAINGQLSGKVTAISGQNVKFTDKNGKSHSVTISDKTKLQNIKAGDNVRVDMQNGKAADINKS